jgi:hypothetical protein
LRDSSLRDITDKSSSLRGGSSVRDSPLRNGLSTILGSGGGGGTREDNILSNNLGFRSERRTAGYVCIEGSRLESGEDGGIDDGGIDDGGMVDGGILIATAGSNHDGRLEKRLSDLNTYQSRIKTP